MDLSSWSFLTNLLSFYSEMTGLVDGRRAVYIVYFDLSTAFDTVSLKIPLHKLVKYGLVEQTVKWI